MILFLGGMSTDLWHVTSESQTLDAAADSAATAGASGIDQAAYNTRGTIQLDPGLANQMALQNLSQQTNLPGPTNPEITVNPDSITVVLHAHVQLTLLQIFLGRRTITLTSTSTAAARAGP